jgi:hypothetical protein
MEAPNWGVACVEARFLMDLCRSRIFLGSPVDCPGKSTEQLHVKQSRRCGAGKRKHPSDQNASYLR